MLFRDVSAEARVQARYKVLLRRETARSQELEEKVAERTAQLEDKVAERTAQLEDALAEITIVSQTDPLTGLPNRRAFDARSTRRWQEARRDRRGLGLLLCDLDHFKQVNDVHGHPAGDRVLTAVARALTDAVRGTDTVARFGGEEFIVLLPHASAAVAEEVARRCVEAVRAIPVSSLVPGYAGPKTISVGAAVAPRHATSLEQLVARADAALYEAKRGGRDTAVVCDDNTDDDSQRWSADYSVAAAAVAAA